MRYLLDTHTLLWFGLDDPQLSPQARAILIDPQHRIEISPASYWEIAIKINIHKYSLNQPFQPFFEVVLTTYGFHILPVEIRHAAILTSLPLHHRDPFDRLIIAQAIADAIPIVSADTTFDKYPVKREW